MPKAEHITYSGMTPLQQAYGSSAWVGTMMLKPTAVPQQQIANEDTVSHILPQLYSHVLSFHPVCNK
jgi:hypothetical protein